MTGAFCCAAARFMPDIVAASPSIRQQRDNALTHDWQCEGQCGSVERSYQYAAKLFSVIFGSTWNSTDHDFATNLIWPVPYASRCARSSIANSHHCGT
jgi:hypothetical protein